MYNGKKILGIIPARGGSKGIPLKNIKEINKKPLISWTIDSAQKSKYLDRYFVSTDSEEIAYIAEKNGAEIPFLRPKELAADDSPSYEAILHAIHKFKENDEFFDYVALLEPTSPLRKADDIDNAISKLVDNIDADSLVTLGEVHMEHPMIVKKINGEYVSPYIDNIKKIYQRQQADSAYFPYGVIYICKTSVFEKEKSFYLKKTIPYYLERWQNYEVDDIIDFNIVEQLINKHFKLI